MVILREIRAGIPDEHQQPLASEILGDRLDPSDELRSEEKNVDIGQFDAVLDLIRGIAEIQRDRDRAGFKNAEIDRQPVQAVHHQDRCLLSLADTLADQQIRASVGFLVKNGPGNGPAVRRG